MGDTYTQIHLQFVFAVKFRAAMIQKSWNERMHQYITGIVQDNKHKMLQINSMPDHIHILVGMRPHQSIAALLQNVKSESTKWINREGFCKTEFAWQSGYGAFSYSYRDVQSVINYIKNQETHHQKKSFQKEYRPILKAFHVEYDERYFLIDPI